MTLINPEDCAAVETFLPRNFWRCRRKACDHGAQVNGGHCPCCFSRIASRPMRPRVITLCGSTRFKDAFITTTRDLTLAGNIVISVGLFGHLEGLDMASDTKVMLDELHKRKIDLSDEIFVINVGGYIGSSTRSEIEYAEWHEKTITYLEPLEGSGQ